MLNIKRFRVVFYFFSGVIFVRIPHKVVNLMAKQTTLISQTANICKPIFSKRSPPTILNDPICRSVTNNKNSMIHIFLSCASYNIGFWCIISHTVTIYWSCNWPVLKFFYNFHIAFGMKKRSPFCNMNFSSRALRS